MKTVIVAARFRLKELIGVVEKSLPEDASPINASEALSLYCSIVSNYGWRLKGAVGAIAPAWGKRFEGDQQEFVRDEVWTVLWQSDGDHTTPADLDVFEAVPFDHEAFLAARESGTV